MMSSQTMQTVIDPVFRNKMPLLDGTTASPGLSKPQTMSGFLGKQTLQYNGAYFAYDPRGKERAGFSPPWSSSKAALQDGRSPVSHLSGMEAQNHIVYRQDSNSSEEGHSRPSSLCRTQGKQGFTAYTKSPGVSSPTTATSVAARKQKTGGENSSPLSENSVYLAIPKPVYRHNPCCSELGCVLGQRYTIEHGSPRIPNTVYEHDWMQTNAHYAERPPIPIKAPDALLQQRGLQQDHSAEPIQRMAVETYSPSRARTFPVMIDPHYGSYPCTPTQTLFGSLSEQSQCLQTPPRAYPSLYPSHASYEHMTSEVYQECSPMSKYGQLAQHPIFYYPQANVEVENRTQCKDISSKQREHVPVILKHTMSNPREHFIVPPSLHGEVPLPNADTLPNHPFMRGFDYSCYAVPRFHLNATQMKHPLKTAPVFHSQRVNASPSTQQMDHSPACVASLHKEKPGAGLHLDKAHSSPPFLHVDRTSPARRTNQSGVSPQRMQLNRFFSPLTSLHLDRTILPPAGVNMDRLVDFNHCESQVTCPKLPKGLPVSPAAWLPRSPCLDSAPAVVTNGASVRKAIYSPAVSTGDERSSSVSTPGTTAVKGCQKRSVSQPSPPINIKKDGDLCEAEHIKKRQKMGMENVQAGPKNVSPPMPVIDNVFSLAPYHAYLQASGVLFQGRSPQRAVKLCEQGEVKIKADVKEKRPDKDERQAGDKSCSESPPAKPVVEITEPKIIKVEKVDPSESEDSGDSPGGQKDCSKITIKKEPDEGSTSDDGSVLVIKMCEPEELETKPLLVEEASDESKPSEPTAAQANSSSQGDSDVKREQVATLQPKSKSPPPPQPQVSFKNIPPQCLKLSTYKILLPEKKSCGPLSPPEKTPLHPLTEFIPKVELQMPVRKHFIELHHALCKLVSKSVSASSDQELRTWLSQLKITEPTSSSTKVQKVSCLLGAKAREVWLNEEMKPALSKVTERLREYTIQERCPFPHVMRTGAVFLPMLVVKELLFPTVQGSFIDQVLQEHKVELRPTTLSEEKILIQLHKHACSSRLRRLMSLKHLPDIYADVVNLYYYSCVCRHLESTSSEVQKRAQD